MARRSDPSRAAFWRQLIERRRHGGLSVAQVCEQAGVSPALFYQWQRKLRGAAAPTRNVQPDRPAASRLVPVHIVADRPCRLRRHAGSRLARRDSSANPGGLRTGDLASRHEHATA
jgi:transposase-like protein